MSSLLGGGGGRVHHHSMPPFHPIDINRIADNALRQDISHYQSMGFPVFPGLSSVRQSEIEDAYKQLTSPLAPEFQQDFMKNATLQARASVGGGDPYLGHGYAEGIIFFR